MRKYLPLILAGLIGGAVYDNGKSLVQKAFNSEPAQRVVGMFRSYDKAEVNPANCKIVYRGQLEWGNNTVRFVNPPYNHAGWGPSDRARTEVDAWYKDKFRHEESYKGEPINASIKLTESAGQSANLSIGVITYDDFIDGRCKPKLIVLENGEPLQGETSSFKTGQSFKKEVKHTDAGIRDYIARIVVNGVVEEFPLGRIHFTGKIFDPEPLVGLQGGGPNRLEVYAIDTGDNRGKRLKEIKVTENGKPVTLESLLLNNGVGWVEEHWRFKPLQLGVNEYVIEVIDNGGNKVIHRVTHDVQFDQNGHLKKDF